MGWAKCSHRKSRCHFPPLERLHLSIPSPILSLGKQGAFDSLPTSSWVSDKRSRIQIARMSSLLCIKKYKSALPIMVSVLSQSRRCPVASLPAVISQFLLSFPNATHIPKHTVHPIVLSHLSNKSAIRRPKLVLHAQQRNHLGIETCALSVLAILGWKRALFYSLLNSGYQSQGRSSLLNLLSSVPSSATSLRTGFSLS